MASQTAQEQPTQTTTPPVQEPQVKPKKNVVLIVALILLFLLMAAGLGYLGYQNYLLRTQLSKFQTTSSPQTETTNNNWKKFTSPDGGFSFEIPQDWDTHFLKTTLIVAPQKEIDYLKSLQGGIEGGKHFVVSINQYYPGNSLLKESSDENRDVTKKTISVDGQQADEYDSLVKQDYPGFNTGDQITTINVKNGAKYLSIDLLDSQYKTTFDHIISSFKLLSDTSIKTYTDSQYGFTFEYPSDWKITQQTPDQVKYIPVSSPDFESGKMFGSCYLYLQDTNHPTSVIGIDKMKVGGDGLFCWSAGYFYDHSNRSISSFDPPQTIDFAKWKVTEKYQDPQGNVITPDWKGDVFQFYGKNDGNGTYSFPAGLLYNTNDSGTPEGVFDLLISTFKFNQ